MSDAIFLAGLFIMIGLLNFGTCSHSDKPTTQIEQGDKE